MSNRTYSQAFGDGKAAPNFPYIWDANYVSTGVGGLLITGNWRMYSTSDISNTSVNVSGLNLSISAVSITGNPNVQVSNFPSITPISGTVTLNSVPTHNIAVTGGRIQTIVTGSVNSIISAISVTGFNSTISPLAISGVTTISPSSTMNVAVTGGAVTGQLVGNITVDNIAITGAPIVTITGVVATSASVTVGNVTVTGGNINVINTAPIPVSGVVVTTVAVGNTAITGFNSTIAPLAVSGSFAATIGNITVTGGRVSVTGGNISISNTAPIPVSGISVLNSVPTHNVTVTGGQVSLTGGSVNILSAINVAVTGGSIRTITTGSFSATVDNTNLISAVASGNAYNAAISGLLSASTVDSAWVTGQVSITNTAPLAISGVVQASVTIGNVAVTGGSILNIETGNRSTNIINTSPIPISGVVVTSTTVGNVAVTGGSIALTNSILAISGISTINSLPNVAVTGASVKSLSSNTASNALPSGTSPFTNMVGITGVALNANANRLSFFVQNIHTGLPLYVLLGNTTPGTGNFSFILNPSINVGWGGDSFYDDKYNGQVNVSGGAWKAFEI